MSYDVVLLLRVNRLERFTVYRLETTSNRPEQYVLLWQMWTTVLLPLLAFSFALHVPVGR